MGKLKKNPASQWAIVTQQLPVADSMRSSARQQLTRMTYTQIEFVVPQFLLVDTPSVGPHALRDIDKQELLPSREPIIVSR